MILPPSFMRGDGRRPGGSPNLCLAKIRKARFAWQNGQDPSAPAAPGFARIHRATSPINRGGKRRTVASSMHKKERESHDFISCH